MIQLHLQDIARTETKPRRSVLLARGLKAHCVPSIMVLVVLVLGVAFQNALGHRIEEQATGAVQAREIPDQSNYLQTRERVGRHKRSMQSVGHLPRSVRVSGNLLSDIGATVHKTRAVWLKSLKDRGASIAIEGTTDNPDAVTELIANLRSTGYFKNIEIKETYQDRPRRDAQAFTFEVTCQIERSRS